MPSDGIHGAFTRNWKSERLRSKCAIRCSESRNVTTATTSENMRIARTFFPLKNSSRSAPSAGVNVTIVRMAEFNASISPQKPRDDQNGAEENPSRVGAHITGLHMA